MPKNDAPGFRSATLFQRVDGRCQVWPYPVDAYGFTRVDRGQAWFRPVLVRYGK